MWRQLPIIGVLAVQLGGCAVWSKAPPSCDGLARRPLNRSLWDWDTGTPLAGPEVPAPPSASPPPIIRKGDASSDLPPTALGLTTPSSLQSIPRIDVVASYRPCGKET